MRVMASVARSKAAAPHSGVYVEVGAHVFGALKMRRDELMVLRRD